MSMEPGNKRLQAFCIGCRSRDDTIDHHARLIAQLRLQKMAYRAALMEVLAKDQVSEILNRHMERLEA